MLLITGGTGFLGKRVCQELSNKRIEYIPIGSSCDLREYSNAKRIIEFVKPEMLVHLAAKVGGIGGNMQSPKAFLVDNLKINTNIVLAAAEADIKKFVAIGSVCMYPKFAPIPFKEEDIWNGYPEETNSPYGISKRVLLELCKVHGYKMVILTNLYGPGADSNLETSHVIPALISKCLTAKEQKTDFTVWGTGKATRDFLHVNDAARGIVAAIEHYDSMPNVVNLATGVEVSIKAIVKIICKAAGFKGKVAYDILKPDGQPRRRVDITKAIKHLKWHPIMPLRDGIREIIQHANSD